MCSWSLSQIDICCPHIVRVLVLHAFVTSALNRTYTLYGLGVHYVQAQGGRPGMTACVARPNA
jgi:hypothetical protein